MQICGLVIEFDPQHVPPAPTLHTLRSWPHCSLGELNGHRLPLVLEAQDPHDTQLWHDRIATLNGVRQVQVAYVAFSDDPKPLHQQESCHAL